MAGPENSLSAQFLGEAGSRFLTVHYSPSGRPVGHIVYIPPFGEEMNRCRAAVANQARNFASSGYSCTIVDFFGTGDSEGELYDASLSVWQRNIEQVINQLQEECRAPTILWGFRLGGLLALDFSSRSNVPIQDIILWQPVTSGKRYVTQLLRQRVASLVGKGLPPETTKEIRERLRCGERVEVSGYTISEELINDIEQIDVAAMSNLCSGKIFWIENVNDLEQDISASSRKIVDELGRRHQTVSVNTFTDPPIWQLHERDSTPQLLSITGALLK